MNCATHMIVSAAIYNSKGYNAPTSFVIIFGMHFIIDSIPHQEISLELNLLLGSMTWVLVYIMAGLRRKIYLWVAVCLGILPDLIVLLSLSEAFIRFHHIMHCNNVIVTGNIFELTIFSFSLITFIRGNEISSLHSMIGTPLYTKHFPI